MNAPSSYYQQKLPRLDRLLSDYQWLWQPQPFKQSRPAWCERLPVLTEQLLRLSDDELALMQGDQRALLALLLPYLPELSDMTPLTAVAEAEVCALKPLNPRFHSAIPGRKWQQIQAFSAAVGKIEHPILEWCGGKGHLGRLMAVQWQQPVTTLEWDAQLSAAGEQLAQRSAVDQHFKIINVLAPLPEGLIQQQHAIALHACGELHRTLVRQAVTHQLPVFDLAPCCYYRIHEKAYSPFTDSLKLQLDHNALRLAVTGVATASRRELKWRDREMVWKLGYELILQQQLGLPYQSIKPFNKQWLREDFAYFCQQLAQRDGHKLPDNIDWQHYQTEGQQRQRESMRLSLPRFAFRRAIEMWLVLDMACYLELNGYNVQISCFCDRTLTPRNLLLSARRSKL